MLFYWFPHEDVLPYANHWIDASWLAPGVVVGMIPNAATARAPAPFMCWTW